nr:unnamed protein product [Digitaria exilis]
MSTALVWSDWLRRDDSMGTVRCSLEWLLALCPAVDLRRGRRARCPAAVRPLRCWRLDATSIADPDLPLAVTIIAAQLLTPSRAA